MPASLGKYYDQVKLGNVFVGSTATAGTAFPLSSNTAQTFGLWNVNSTKNVVPLMLSVGFTSGTIAIGTVGLIHKNAGFAIGTGAPISAFTDGTLGTTIFNAMPGYGGAPSARFTPSAATIVAGSAFYWTGSFFTTAPTDGPAATFNHDFDGRVILAPGQAAFVVGSIAQTGVFTMSLMWAEVDI